MRASLERQAPQALAPTALVPGPLDTPVSVFEIADVIWRREPYQDGNSSTDGSQMIISIIFDPDAQMLAMHLAEFTTEWPVA